MKVSVVIPCYNRSWALAGAIATVMSQQHEDWEIIVVDDGSEDVELSQEIVDQIGDSRIRLVRHAENRGQTAATNTGMAMARGEGIALLDTDDRWHESKLELQIQRFRQEGDPLAVIYPQSVLITNSDKVIKRTVMPDSEIRNGERVTDYLFCGRGFIQSSGIFFSREVANKVVMREGLRRHTDYDFLIALEQYGCRFFMVHQPLVEVDWIDVHLRKKGRSMEPSFQFLEVNSQSFSSRSRTSFVLQQVVLPLLSDRGDRSQLIKGLIQLNPLLIGVVGYLKLLSIAIFGDERLLRGAISVRNGLRLRS